MCVVNMRSGAGFDLFLSHNWGLAPYANHTRVVALAADLEARGVHVWLDETNMGGNIMTAMTDGIEQSRAVLVCVTRDYIAKVGAPGADNCKLEFNHAYQRKGPEAMLAVAMDPDVASTRTWTGPVGAVLSTALYASCDADDICAKLRAMGIALGRAGMPGTVFAYCRGIL